MVSRAKMERKGDESLYFMDRFESSIGRKCNGLRPWHRYWYMGADKTYTYKPWRTCRSSLVCLFLWAILENSSLTGHESEVGDRVMLKVSPWKGVVHFRKKGKLASRYVGPFEILERIGLVAYRLSFVEEPVEIMDCEIKSLKRSKISLVKVRWNSKRGPEMRFPKGGDTVDNPHTSPFTTPHPQPPPPSSDFCSVEIGVLRLKYPRSCYLLTSCDGWYGIGSRLIAQYRLLNWHRRPGKRECVERIPSE
ncbi:hypothetical protein Tco_1215588 [Tanacetum coccineum]